MSVAGTEAAAVVDVEAAAAVAAALDTFLNFVVRTWDRRHSDDESAAEQVDDDYYASACVDRVCYLIDMCEAT